MVHQWNHCRNLGSLFSAYFLMHSFIFVVLISHVLSLIRNFRGSQSFHTPYDNISRTLSSSPRKNFDAKNLSQLMLFYQLIPALCKCYMSEEYPNISSVREDVLNSNYLYLSIEVFLDFALSWTLSLEK